jgi:hypothetical protein
MNGEQGKRVEHCPLRFTVCFPSCHWWRRDFVCSFAEEMQARKQAEELRAMRDSSR